ncbi:MAG: amino acid ABC transporter permease [Treponema sp.]|jgi:L-cystine transport system permease protein|nr:amino acid ABC transporter permease [Treponema sp.]
MFKWEYVWRYLPRVISAAPTTLLIVAVAMAAGLVVGMFITFFRVEKIPVLNQLSVVFVSFVRGTPILAQLFVVYYGLPAVMKIFGVNIMRAEKIFFVFLTYALNSGAFLSENFRSAILSVSKSQWDAAAAIGLNKLQIYLRVIIPQSVVVAIPSVGTFLSQLLQDTSLAFALGIIDIVGKINTMGASISHVLEGYCVAAVLFTALTFGIERAFAFIEKKMRTQNAPV